MCCVFGCSLFSSDWRMQLFACGWKLPAYSGAFLLTVGFGRFVTYSWSFFAYSFSFSTYNCSFLTYSGKVCLISTLTDCKQRSSTVSQKARTVSKRASPWVESLWSKIGENRFRMAHPNRSLSMFSCDLAARFESCDSEPPDSRFRISATKERPETSNLPKVVGRGCKRCFGVCGQKACCTGAKQGCTGESDSWKTISPAGLKHLCTRSTPLWAIVRFWASVAGTQGRMWALMQALGDRFWGLKDTIFNGLWRHQELPWQKHDYQSTICPFKDSEKKNQFQ